MKRELAEKRGKKQAVAKEKRVVCVRCGAEETINPRGDEKGPGLVRTLGLTCGGCSGDECRIEEVEEKKALLVVGFFREARALPVVGFFSSSLHVKR